MNVKHSKSPADRVVKDIRGTTRKQYSAEEKIRIVLDGLCGKYSIAELDTRNNHGFGAMIGRIAAIGARVALWATPIGRSGAVFIGFSVCSVDFRRSYPVAAHRSWKIRRSKL